MVNHVESRPMANQAEETEVVDIELPLERASERGRGNPTVPEELWRDVTIKKEPSNQEVLRQQYEERLLIIRNLQEGQELANKFEPDDTKLVPGEMKAWIEKSAEELKNFPLYQQGDLAAIKSSLRDMFYYNRWDQEIERHRAVMFDVIAKLEALKGSVGLPNEGGASESIDQVKIDRILKQFAHLSRPMPLSSGPKMSSSSGHEEVVGGSSLWGRLWRFFQ